jgi:hypothetical protein
MGFTEESSWLLISGSKVRVLVRPPTTPCPALGFFAPSFDAARKLDTSMHRLDTFVQHALGKDVEVERYAGHDARPLVRRRPESGRSLG